ncbi:hypothetical protein CH63R_08377 [Colletotrichum higginsianum IMI 349063]|uniref:Uncharacterized protein n=1 Tax=Colletotrichum higginsianum (strain IMI 349063) TaxID=759273 RepID=A0A1B7YC08_COLHI|nr:hypothetical protein CH63R_08377 [Colletotrichum higginsianum IMI 349063]OBR09612.1 hypothetical protein CH63R_08377 [Colletotrichum higginsianum IMI 349063]
MLQSWLTPVSVCFLAPKQCFCSTIIFLFTCHDAIPLPSSRQDDGIQRRFLTCTARPRASSGSEVGTDLLYAENETSHVSHKTLSC